jgi:hypothetical protein
MSLLGQFLTSILINILASILDHFLAPILSIIFGIIFNNFATQFISRKSILWDSTFRVPCVGFDLRKTKQFFCDFVFLFLSGLWFLSFKNNKSKPRRSPHHLEFLFVSYLFVFWECPCFGIGIYKFTTHFHFKKPLTL